MENWNESEEYAKWEAAVKQIWERVVEGKEAIKFAEYEKVLSFIHGVVSTGNAARASQVGYMTHEDFFKEGGEENEDEEENREEVVDDGSMKGMLGKIVTLAAEP